MSSSSSVAALHERPEGEQLTGPALSFSGLNEAAVAVISMGLHFGFKLSSLLKERPRVRYQWCPLRLHLGAYRDTPAPQGNRDGIQRCFGCVEGEKNE